jgi:hypothetical protein
MCLIDWTHSVAYPPGSESAAFSIQPAFTDFNQAVLSLIPRHHEEELQLDAIGFGLNTAALA